jgi:hypothetical protein
MHIEPEHHREVHKTGHNWLDLMIALTALLISATSLVVTIVHSRTLERMADANARLVEANSWPFLSYDTSNGPAISMSISNDGIGPAKVEAIEVKWAGRAQRDAVDFLKACCGFVPKTADVEYEVISGRVLRAGQSANILKLPRTAPDDAAFDALDHRARISSKLTINVCYWSIFDQCWTKDILRFSRKPRELDHCTSPAVPYVLPP